MVQSDQVTYTKGKGDLWLWRRAANPSVDLSVVKSDFKRSNLILSVVYMVLHHNFPKTCARCLTWLAAEKAMLCTTIFFFKLWKASPLKLHPNTVKIASHNHKMGNIQRTSYCFSFVKVMLPVDALFDVVHSAMGDSKVPRSRHCT